MISRAACWVTSVLALAARAGAFHVTTLTARRTTVELAAKSPMDRFDEVLDYFEGKVGLYPEPTDRSSGPLT